ncbi:hypothetical protein E7T09_08885 [Deinococcus sp. KSM4-11]|uniref:hypothetical protein n=1 Tax=Deinococcus sp. KSM4-11 TaxID=2568654 RepID=UPI0010A3052C|nr:hypothetical protein [Deinococcus sp. KSM4-11]THF87250.1 hypothetical protein E7T09_08885 [Deinococcus sp. KSM4-11]
MKARRAATPLPHRWVLALLTVVASFAFLTRQPEPSGGGGLPAVMGVMAGMATPEPPRAALTSSAMDRAPKVRGDATPHAVRMSAPHDLALLDTSAPNAPPASHDHAAHCPFCFTAAFALEAAGVALPSVVIGGMEWAATAYRRPVLAAPAHADARAPPHS